MSVLISCLPSQSHLSYWDTKSRKERKNSMGQLSVYCFLTPYSMLISLLVILELDLLNISFFLPVDGCGVRLEEKGAYLLDSGTPPVLSVLLQCVAARSTQHTQWCSSSHVPGPACIFLSLALA